MKRLNSIIISVMMSDSRVFTVKRFPDWTRVIWLLWLFVPVAAAAFIAAFETVRSDWLAGCYFIATLIVPPLPIMAG